MALSAIGKAARISAGSTDSPSGTESVSPPALPEPGELTFTGDPAAALAALLVKTGQEAKTIDRALQEAQERLQTEAEKREVDAMHAKADAIRSEGIEQGLLGAASGLATMGAGATFGSNPSGSGTSRLFEGGARLLEGSAKLCDGSSRGEISDDETDAKLAEQIAGRAKRAVDSAHDFQKDDADLIKTAIEFYKEYSGAASAARSAALHRS